MPALQYLLNYQKGKLLASLFPEDTAGYIKFLYTCGEKITSDRRVFNSILLPYPAAALEQWQQLAGEINHAIDQYGARLQSNSHLFGYEIFDYFRGSYSIHCLRSYAKFQLPTSKYRQMIDILFS
ncbi:MAG: hypothetical protein ACTHMC_22250 [Pseudobacter sp.]|uniref:hypothetical protein n=1 Tax=Pseudobacter sp. TaxID=2045420 RepID=UPI003F7E5339